MVVSLGGLAGWAGVAILVDLLTKLGPPIPSADVVPGPLGSQVHKHLMCLGDDHSDDHVTLDFHVGYAEDFLSASVIGVHEVTPQSECGMML